MKDFDAIVMGSGPAGLSAAFKLFKLGRRVAIVSGKHHKRQKQLETVPNTAILTHVFSLECLDGFGIIDHERCGISYWSGIEKNTYPVTVVDRVELDKALHSYISTVGIEMYAVDKNAISVTFDYVWNITFEGKHFRSPFIVDATGRHSIFNSRQVLVPWKQTGFNTEFTMDENIPGLWTESLEDGWLWGIRETDNQYMISFFVDPSSVSGNPRLICNQMLKQSRMAKNCKPISKNITAYDVTPSAAAFIYKDGVIPVGDASLTRDPLGSQGLSGAISDGQAVAIAIHAILADSSKSCIAVDFLKQRHDNAILKHQIFLNESYADAPFETSFWTTRRAEHVSSVEETLAIDIHIDSLLTRSERCVGWLESPL